MANITPPLTTLATLVALCLHVAPAQALFTRTVVSAAIGNDANDCSAATPCRTFQRAHDQTFPDGEITVLDPGGYGSLTITKSISIVNDGVGEASILVSGGATGITIRAGAASYVNLRGITVQGIGFGGGTGLQFSSGFSLTMTNCVIRNHTGDGIGMLTSGNSSLAVSNTLLADNGGSGIQVNPSAGSAEVVLNRVEMYNNSASGLSVIGLSPSVTEINATVADSVAANNGIGFRLTATGPTHLMVIRSIAANNGIGLQAGIAPLGTIWVGQSTVTGNNTTWLAGGAHLQSFGDNYIAGNKDGDPSLPDNIAKK